MSVSTSSRWFRRGLMATALLAAGALTMGAAPHEAKAQYYYPYGYGYYQPYYSYYSPYYYPYYGYYPYAPVNVSIGWGWGWGGWGWHHGWHHGWHRR